MSNTTLPTRDADKHVPPIGAPAEMAADAIEDVDDAAIEPVVDAVGGGSGGARGYVVFLIVWIVAGVLIGVLIDRLTNAAPERVVDASTVQGTSFDIPIAGAPRSAVAGNAVQINGAAEPTGTSDASAGNNAADSNDASANTTTDDSADTADNANAGNANAGNANAGNTANRADANNGAMIPGPDIPPPGMGRALEAALGQLRPAPRDGYTAASFDHLASFDYGEDDMESLMRGEKPKVEIPAEFLALDGTRVALNGFFTPLETPPTQKFVLMRFLMSCCFGRFPRLNEWVQVEMAGSKRVDLPIDSMITVYGTLEVKVVYDEAGWCERIFRIVADDVIKISIGGR